MIFRVRSVLTEDAPQVNLMLVQPMEGHAHCQTYLKDLLAAADEDMNALQT